MFERAAPRLRILAQSPPAREDVPVRYPGWYEAERARANHREGIPLAEPLYRELCALASTLSLPIPAPIGVC